MTRRSRWLTIVASAVVAGVIAAAGTAAVLARRADRAARAQAASLASIINPRPGPPAPPPPPAPVPVGGVLPPNGVVRIRGDAGKRMTVAVVRIENPAPDPTPPAKPFDRTFPFRRVVRVDIEVQNTGSVTFPDDLAEHTWLVDAYGGRYPYGVELTPPRRPATGRAVPGGVELQRDLLRAPSPRSHGEARRSGPVPAEPASGLARADPGLAVALIGRVIRA